MAATFFAFCAAAAAVVAITAAATLAPPIPPPAHADGPEPGSLAFSFGSLGSDPGEFNGIDDVDVGPDGKIYVADHNNRRVSVFHPNGTFAFEVFPGGSGPWAVAAGPDGKIYAGMSFGVVVFHPNGTRDFYLRVSNAYVSGVAAGPDGKIYAGTSNYVVKVFHPNGTYAFEFGSLGSDDGEFGSPPSVFVGPDGKIYAGGQAFR